MEIFSAFGLSASAGLNAYIPLLMVALLAKFTPWLRLNEPWDALTSWWVIGLLVVLSIIEFFADKIPAVNHVNDILQTFIRPAAGAIVFAASTSVIKEIHPILAISAGILVAGGVHAAKSLVFRPAVTAVSGGTANVPVSIAEDIISTILSILSVVVPVLIACILILITTTILWMWLRKIRTASSAPKT
ncbi:MULTISPECIES: DUF4126 domain-containing protein [Anaerolinea]|uniref:DUF4126 domain-containing protein n=1 Tax=Anaerolinea TaxID=233189 RepID=UPI002619C833|nr:DUF4126 domain-containing protein [Anaerolinea thermophila]